MTESEVIDAAREADLYMTSPERIAAVIRFSAIIEAKTREKQAMICEESKDRGNDRGIERDVYIWNKASEYCANAIRGQR